MNYRTRPDSINSKAGTSGNPVKLSANYFKMVRKPTFAFTLYRVDFEPDFEIEGLRKAFVGRQREYLGGYLFDGQNMLYLTRRLPDDLVTFQVESREGQEYKMTIKYTGTQIDMTDNRASQILNIILRRTMDGLQMQLVGRNMYDAGNKVSWKDKIENSINFRIYRSDWISSVLSCGRDTSRLSVSTSRTFWCALRFHTRFVDTGIESMNYFSQNS
jgi:aubergine